MYGLLKIVLCFGIYFLLYFSITTSTRVAAILDFAAFTLASLILTWHLSTYLQELIYNAKRRGPEVDPKGKCALVTGCDTGFGHDIALTLNETGFTVFAGCLFKDQPEAQSLLKKCAHPEKMMLLSLNITKDSDVNNAFKVIESHTQRTGEVLHSLVNNAGISGFAPFEWGTFKEDIYPVLEVNLNASIKVTRAMIPLLRQNPDSRIIFMLSYVTYMAMPFVASYCISKCGLKAFADTLRKDIENNDVYFNGIKVITIEPTCYKTGIMGYTNIKNTLKKSWSRTDPEVKASYGDEMFDAMYAFISTCEFFRWFDFVALNRNVHEVAKHVNICLIQKKPVYDLKLITKGVEITSRIHRNYLPQDVIEGGFTFLAWIGYIYARQVAIVKKVLNAIFT